MSFAQSACSGNVVTLPYALGALSPASGICLVVDIYWQVAGTNAGTLTVTDDQGHTYTQVFASSAAGVSSLGAPEQQGWSTWIALSLSKGVSPPTITVAASLGASDMVVAVHEYNNVTGFDVYSSNHARLSDPVSLSLTITQSIEQLHTFACTRLVLDSTQLAGPYAVTTPLGSNVSWVQRENALGPSFMKTADAVVSVSTTYTVNWGDQSTPLQPAAYGAILSLKIFQNPRFPSPGVWLHILEPGIGLTDRTPYLALEGDQAAHTFTLPLFDRGTADIALKIAAGDSYFPTEGSQIFLYDWNPVGWYIVFAGFIERIIATPIGKKGDQAIQLACVSFKKCFDTLRIPPRYYFYQTAGSIFEDLYNTVAAGVPVPLGTINATFVVQSLSFAWDSLSDAFNQLAQLASCVWDIDMTNLTCFFQPPSDRVAPFVLDGGIRFESTSWQINNQDYRNFQILEISKDAFAGSAELFPVGTLPSSYTLMRPVSEVTDAWLTKNVQNQATGIFTGQPSPGDTISIGYPTAGSIYNWAPNAPYDLGQIIVDSNNNIQVVTSKGTSGGSQPTWNTTVGASTSDGPGSPVRSGFNGGVIWQNKGQTGAGGIGAATYTFVEELDNAEWGQVLIGSDLAHTVYYLVLAINADQTSSPQTPGSYYSYPTWENPLVNAVFGTDRLTVRNKGAGEGYIASLSKSCSVFSWDSSQTHGGSTAGPGGTYQLQVAAQGSSNTANLYYTPGSNVVGLVSRPSGLGSTTGYSLQVGYTSIYKGFISAELTDQVNLRAAIEGGTGRYQQKTSLTDVISNTLGYQYARSMLAAYGLQIPISWSFIFWRPGLMPGHLLVVALNTTAFDAKTQGLLNGEWIVQEITGELVPARPYIDQSVLVHAGHYQYTVTLINASQALSYLAFWNQLASGGGGGGGTPSVIGATLGPETPLEHINEYTLVPSGGSVTITLDNGINLKLVLTSTPFTITAPVQAIGTEFTLNLENSIQAPPVPTFTGGSGGFVSNTKALIAAVFNPNINTATVVTFVFRSSGFWQLKSRPESGLALT